MKKRFLGMLPALAMVLLLLPVGAFATETWTKVSTEESLLDAFSKGGNIKLENEITLSREFKIEKAVNLDLNGKKLIIKDSGNISDGGALTVSDNGSGGSMYFGYDKFINIETNGSLTLNSGTIESNHYATISNSGTFVMNDGTLKTTIVSNYCLFYINGGTFDMGSDPAIGNSATMYANGGTITGTLSSDSASSVRNYGTLTVEENRAGTTFDCTVSNGVGGIIDGGIFKGKVKNLYNYKKKSAGTITGGTFDSEVENRGIIFGGTFNEKVNNVSSYMNGYNRPVECQSILYATADVTGATINYDTAGSVVTYKIGESEYAKQVVKTNSNAKEPTAPGKEGYTFAGWYTDAACTDAFDFENTPITGGITLYADFREAAQKAGTGTTNYRLVHTYIDGEGTVDPAGDIMVRDGSDKTFTLTPAAGYEVGDVVVNHRSLGAVTSFTVKGIDTDTSVEVTFVKSGSAVVGTKSVSNPSTGAQL